VYEEQQSQIRIARNTFPKTSVPFLPTFLNLEGDEQVIASLHIPEDLLVADYL
jgi:hypothetical protein